MLTLIAILIIFVCIDALYDAAEYVYRTRGTNMHKFNDFKVTLICFTLYVGYIVGRLMSVHNLDIELLIRIIFAYLLIRFAIFNIIFNLSANLKWYFLGTTKWLDRAEVWIISKLKVPQSNFFLTIRIILLCVAIGLLLNY